MKTRDTVSVWVSFEGRMTGVDEGGDDVVWGADCSGLGVGIDGVLFRAVMMKLGFVNWVWCDDGSKVFVKDEGRCFRSRLLHLNHFSGWVELLKESSFWMKKFLNDFERKKIAQWFQKIKF